jgi:hypothetical protein
MYGVHFNVSGDPIELAIGTNQPIIAFILPKWTAGQTKDAICLSCRKPFQRLHDLGDARFGSDQYVYVIWHDHEAVEQVLCRIPVSNRISHHLSNIGSLQIEWAGRMLVKKTVHRKERLTRCCLSRKRPISGENAVQAPSDEQGLADFVDVRQPASMEMRHKTPVGRFPEYSQQLAGK